MTKNATPSTGSNRRHTRRSQTTKAFLRLAGREADAVTAAANTFLALPVAPARRAVAAFAAAAATTCAIPPPCTEAEAEVAPPLRLSPPLSSSERVVLD